MDIEAILRAHTTPICLSGGAVGADVAWGRAAKALGHQVLHFSFTGHKSMAPHNESVKLTHSELSGADPAVKRANQTLRRTFPSKLNNVNNLIRRNWYQIAWTDSVYAVGNIGKNYDVDGGTAWAVQMYIDRFIHDRENIQTCELYFFDQLAERWLRWHNEWHISAQTPPAPTGIWTGIGSRKITIAGENEIINVTSERSNSKI